MVYGNNVSAFGSILPGRRRLYLYLAMLLLASAIVCGIIFFGFGARHAQSAQQQTSSLVSTTTATSTLGGHGALNLTVLYNGAPAPGASIMLSPGNYTFLTGRDGKFSGAYVLAPGTYFLTASFNGQSASASITISDYKTTGATVRISGPQVSTSSVPTTITTTKAPS